MSWALTGRVSPRVMGSDCACFLPVLWALTGRVSPRVMGSDWACFSLCYGL